MASIADTLNSVIAQRGLTEQQVQAQYGLQPSSTDWMKNAGVKFASTPTMTSPGVATATTGTLTAPPLTRAPDIAAPQGSASLYAAPQATLAAPVAAGTATAQQATGLYGATAPGVSAGTATAGQATATGYGVTDASASLRAADPNATVEGRIGGIIAADSPLQQMAKTRALQEQNRRGTLNSSMAVQAGQAALYQAALPIAQQDAASEGERQAQNAQLGTQVSLANADSHNRAAEFGATAQNRASEVNAQLATDVSKFNVDNALKAGIVNQEQANAMQRFNAQLGTEVNLANMRDANEMQQFLLDQYLKASIINQDQANRMAQFNATTAADAAKFNSASINDMVKANMDNLFKARVINQQQANEMSRAENEQAAKMAMFQLQTDADVAKFNASESNALTKLGIDSATKMELANIEAQYKTLMQTSASASEVYKQMLAQVALVQTNKDMSASAKRDAIGNLTGMLNASLDVIGEVSNLSLPELNFTSGVASPSTSPMQPGDAALPQAAPSPTSGSDLLPASQFPSSIGGQEVDWDSQGTGLSGNALPSLRDVYDQYRSAGGTLSPVDWYMQKARPPQAGLYDSGGGA